MEELKTSLDKSTALAIQQTQYFEKEKANLKQHLQDMEQQYVLMVKKIQSKLKKEKEENDPIH